MSLGSLHPRVQSRSQLQPFLSFIAHTSHPNPTLQSNGVLDLVHTHPPLPGSLLELLLSLALAIGLDPSSVHSNVTTSDAVPSLAAAMISSVLT